MRFVFFGTDEFVVPVLSALLAMNEYECVGVVTAPDRKGRGSTKIPSPVKLFAEEKKVPVFTPEKLKDFFEIYTTELHPDFAVIASYGKIISQKFIDATPKGILNIHPSLLPKHRGPSPVPATILSGDTETGVAIMNIDAGVDTGEILATERMSLSGDETTPLLLSKLFEKGAKMLVEVLPAYLNGTLTLTPQDHSQSTHTTMFAKEDGKLNFHESAEMLERKIRALNPWPGTFATLEGSNVKILKCRVASELKKELHPGTIATENSQFFVGTGTVPLEILELKPEGKTAQAASEFLRGHNVHGKTFL